MKKIFFIIFVAVCFLFFITAGGYFFIKYQINRPYSHQAAEIIFAIEKGESSKTIAQNLEKNKLIKNHYYFLFYLWQKNLNGKLQAGEYSLRPNMAIPEMVEIFVQGRVKPNWAEVTIPEGFTVKQIDVRLAEAGLIKAGDLINFDLSKLKDFEVYVMGNKLQSLEGFLFPDTYRFEKEANLKEIIQKMLENFNAKVGPLQPEIQKQGKSVYQILIMASILEKEVKTEEDWKVVSGIFWHRLKIGQPLESCATIAYVLGVDKWRYSYADTRIKSSYNTYLNRGLPPTPINNPGLSTISAAIYPIETDYNFFLTDPKTDQTIFSKTLEEHNRNKAKYF